jgi:hypothetical protein
MARQAKIKVRKLPIIFFDIKDFSTNNLCCQAIQSIPHSTVTFYGDCVKMCEDFPEKKLAFA